MKAPPGVEFRRCAKIAQFYFRQQKNDVRQQKTNIGQKGFAKMLLRCYISRTKPKNRNDMNDKLILDEIKLNGCIYYYNPITKKLYLESNGFGEIDMKLLNLDEKRQIRNQLKRKS